MPFPPSPSLSISTSRAQISFFALLSFEKPFETPRVQSRPVYPEPRPHLPVVPSKVQSLTNRINILTNCESTS